MKPVQQTKFGTDGGNCTQACLASILELPLEAVPNPGIYWGAEDETTRKIGWEVLDWFLRDLGLQLVQLDLADVPADERHGRPEGYWIATTDQGRWSHATVWHHDLFVHDPDPRGFPLGPVTHVNYLVVLDPVKVGSGLWRLRGEHS